MRKLDRTAAPPPASLAHYKHGANTWNDLLPEHKEQIWAQLDQMQRRLCAYCEGSLDEGQHIEHFRRKSLHPRLTFAWVNLFGSCNREECCGHFKDTGGSPYNPDDLINPCDDDPDDFFRFYSDGTIRVRDGLSPTHQRRATETLRVFNLQAEHGRLRALRRQAFVGYEALEGSIVEALLGFSEADRRDFIREEIQRTADEPFSTVIRHLFQDLL